MSECLCLCFSINMASNYVNTINIIDVVILFRLVHQLHHQYICHLYLATVSHNVDIRSVGCTVYCFLVSAGKWKSTEEILTAPDTAAQKATQVFSESIDFKRQVAPFENVPMCKPEEAVSLPTTFHIPADLDKQGTSPIKEMHIYLPAASQNGNVFNCGVPPNRTKGKCLALTN